MKILLLFAGQGYMKPDLYHIFTTDSKAIEWMQSVQKQLKLDLSDDASKFIDPVFTQRLISLYQLGMCSLLAPQIEQHDIELVGYSLGEVSAYMFSIGLSIPEINNCVKYRTQIMMDILSNGGGNDYNMVSVYGRFGLEEINEWCKKYGCFVAIINSNNHVVISGKIKNIQLLLRNQVQFFSKSHFLSIPLPSHTPLYKHQSQQFEQFLFKNYSDKPMKYPILSTLSHEKNRDNKLQISLLASALSNPLEWYKINHLIEENQYDLIFDLGPGRAMSDMLMEQDKFKFDERIMRLSEFKTIAGIKNHLNNRLVSLTDKK